jgi:hypothetical protein
MGEEEHLEEVEIQRTKAGMEISHIGSCLFKSKFDEMKQEKTKEKKGQ